jgi:hypothetical protein
MTLYRTHVGITARFLSAMGLLSGAACASQSMIDYSAASPPSELVQFARMKVDPDNPGSLKVFGQEALLSGKIGGPANSWLLPMQESTNRYCLFAEARLDPQEFRELASFVSCQVLDVQFFDFNVDGRTDVLYKLRVQSNRHEAWTSEEILFLAAPDHKSFCKSVRTPKFSPRAPQKGIFSC